MIWVCSFCFKGVRVNSVCLFCLFVFIHSKITIYRTYTIVYNISILNLEGPHLSPEVVFSVASSTRSTTTAMVVVQLMACSFRQFKSLTCYLHVCWTLTSFIFVDKHIVGYVVSLYIQIGFVKYIMFLFYWNNHIIVLYCVFSIWILHVYNSWIFDFIVQSTCKIDED